MSKITYLEVFFMSWKVIKEFPTEEEAIIVMGRLQSEGIAARVTCDNVGGLYSGIAPALVSAKLYVDEQDIREALEILKEL